MSAWSCVLHGFVVLSVEMGQSVTVKRYPAELSLATLICLAGAVEASAVALVAERHSHAWALGWDYRLYAPLYTVCSNPTLFYIHSSNFTLVALFFWFGSYITLIIINLNQITDSTGPFRFIKTRKIKFHVICILRKLLTTNFLWFRTTLVQCCAMLMLSQNRDGFDFRWDNHSPSTNPHAHQPPRDSKRRSTYMNRKRKDVTFTSVN